MVPSGRGAATRDHLIAVATRLFAERTYEGTSIEAVLAEAGVSRGALYHHFASKEELFEAVLEALEVDVGERLQAETGGIADTRAALRAGGRAWMRLTGDPVVRRIVLVDAPSVLGWKRWRAAEEAHALGMLKAGLQPLADTGEIPPDMVYPFPHVLRASLNETALVLPNAADQAAGLPVAERAVDEVLTRLLGAGPVPTPRSGAGTAPAKPARRRNR
jgi:AcrR family transcriptional regulator